jgi:3-oxoacyl-[acyl-carrier-protein] synthase II
LALTDAGLDIWSETRNIAIIASTVYGCLDTDERYYDTVLPEEGRLASPSLFAYTLPNAFLGEAAIHFGLSGASYVINESSPSGLFGLSFAINSIKMGEHEAIIVGICDYGPPPIFSMTNRSFPGALFFVLQNDKPGKQHLSYGKLTQDKKKKLFLNGEEIVDLDTLAVMCTKVRGIPKRAV